MRSKLSEWLIRFGVRLITGWWLVHVSVYPEPPQHVQERLEREAAARIAQMIDQALTKPHVRPAPLRVHAAEDVLELPRLSGHKPPEGLN